jgi:GTP-binding protein Era
LQAGDRAMAARLAPLTQPLIVAVNKIDRQSKDALLPLLAAIAALAPRADVVPLSALTGDNLERLLACVVAALPEGPSLYDDEEVTTETERAIVAETVREKVMLETRAEVPYAVAVTIDAFDERAEKNLTVIKATIHVERDPQKAIVIGHRGQRLKAIGQAARAEIETLLGRRVFLELFVRVQRDWTKHPARLKEFGL